MYIAIYIIAHLYCQFNREMMLRNGHFPPRFLQTRSEKCIFAKKSRPEKCNGETKSRSEKCNTLRYVSQEN